MDISNLITQVKEIKINEYLEQKYGYNGKGTGKNIFYHCPFHNEKTPSFSVWDNGQMWTCHGACNCSGDILDLVMRLDRLEFMQALEKLCQWSGIKFSYQQSPHLEIVQKAAEKYHDVIWKCIEAYPQVGKWVEDRKVNEDSISHFQIGCTPFNKPDLMTQTLLKEYDKKDLIIAGLTIEKDGKLFDRHRNGIIIPIKNFNGKIVGFSSVTLPVNKSYKYVNSPSSYFFNKRHLLFNLNDARKGDSDYLIFVEGYMDVIALRQQGEFGVIATMGTPTAEQILSIPKSVSTIYLAFDNDKSGKEYTKLFMEQLPTGHHITPDNVKFVIYSGHDPDECVTKHGGVWSNAMQYLSIPVLEYMHTEISKHPKVGGNVSTIINRLAPHFSKLKPVEFDQNINLLHKLIDNKAIQSDSIRLQMNQEIKTWKSEQVTSGESQFTTEQYVLCSYIWNPFVLGVDFPNADLAIKNPEEVFTLDRHVKMYNACFEDGIFAGQNLDQFRDLSEYFSVLTDLYEMYLTKYHVNIERDLRPDIIKSVARLKQDVLRKKLREGEHVQVFSPNE